MGGVYSVMHSSGWGKYDGITTYYNAYHLGKTVKYAEL